MVIGVSQFNNVIFTKITLLVSLSSVLKLGYMDDVTLGGLQKTVAKDIKLIMNADQGIGLNLNTAKCKLVGNPGCHIIWYASRSTAKQTVFLGPTKPTSRPLSHQSIHGRAVADGTVYNLCMYVKTKVKNKAGMAIGLVDPWKTSRAKAPYVILFVLCFASVLECQC